VNLLSVNQIDSGARQLERRGRITFAIIVAMAIGFMVYWLLAQ